LKERQLLFNSPLFVLIFLPVVFIFFETVPKQYRLWVLFVASMVFYGYSGLKPLGAMIVSIFWVYGIIRYSEFISIRAAKLLVVVGPLSVLFLFRYLDFTFNTIGIDLPARQSFSFFLDVLVPAGISFYTFQIISYAIDVLDGTVKKESRLLNLVTFISFFPQLIAGPIVRYKQVCDQFENIRAGHPLNRDFCVAVQLIVIGLVYKVLIADGMGHLHGRGVAPYGGTIDTWLAVFIYSFQIYYDFYGYSLIAIGLGKLFGIDLPQNFDRPYMALNPKVFWKRWHMTLSLWLRDYVYFKMGGNQSYFRNILLVFAAVGLWHGADWSFVIWGLYHAALVIGYKLTEKVWDRFPEFVQISVCFFLITMGWPLFYLDLNAYVGLLQQLLVDTDQWRQFYQIQEYVFVGIVAVWTFLPKALEGKIKAPLWKATKFPAVQAVLLFGAFLMFNNGFEFIYFRF